MPFNSIDYKNQQMKMDTNWTGEKLFLNSYNDVHSAYQQLGEPTYNGCLEKNWKYNLLETFKKDT